jgi:hypothetical protein
MDYEDMMGISGLIAIIGALMFGGGIAYIGMNHLIPSQTILTPLLVGLGMILFIGGILVFVLAAICESGCK